MPSQPQSTEQNKIDNAPCTPIADIIPETAALEVRTDGQTIARKPHNTASGTATAIAMMRTRPAISFCVCITAERHAAVIDGVLILVKLSSIFGMLLSEFTAVHPGLNSL